MVRRQDHDEYFFWFGIMGLTVYAITPLSKIYHSSLDVFITSEELKYLFLYCLLFSRKSNDPDDTIHIVEMEELDTAYNTDSTRHLTKNEDYQTIDVDGIGNISRLETYDYEYSSVQKTRSKLDSVEWKNSPLNVSQQITENEIDDEFREEPDTEVSNYRRGIESAHVIQNGSEYTLINKSFKTNK